MSEVWLRNAYGDIYVYNFSLAVTTVGNCVIYEGLVVARLQLMPS
jgi:hypothetical protein